MMKALTSHTGFIASLTLLVFFAASQASPTPTQAQARIVTIDDAPATVSQTCPSGTGSAAAKGLAIVPQDNGDITMCLSNELTKDIMSIRQEHCPKDVTDECRELWQKAISGGEMTVNGRAIGAGILMFSLLVGYVAHKFEERLHEDVKFIPVSFQLPAAEKSEMQEAIEASQGVALVGSGVPAAVITAPPKPSAASNAVASLTTATVSMNKVSDESLILNLDQGSLHWLQQQVVQPICNKTQNVQRRANAACTQTIIDLGHLAMSQLASGAFKGFIDIVGPDRLLEDPNMASAVSNIYDYARNIDELALISDVGIFGITTLVALITKAVILQDEIDSVMTFPLSLFSDEKFKSQGSKVSVSATSASQTKDRYLVVPSTDAQMALLQKQISSIMEGSDMSYYTWLTSTNNFWDITPVSSQKTKIEKLQGIQTVMKVSSMTEQSMTLSGTWGPGEASATAKARERRNEDNSPASDEQRHSKHQVVQDTNTTHHQHQKRDDLPNKVQTFNPNQEQFDLKYYVVPPGTVNDQLLQRINFVYPDLADVPTWVYVIETSLDKHHPEFRYARDAGLFDDNPLVHPDVPFSPKVMVYERPEHHGTAVVTKLIGELCGSIKHVKIILVSYLGVQGVDDHWIWKSIHDDILNRRTKGEALRGRTFVYSALSQFWGDDNILLQDPLDFEALDKVRKDPAKASVKNSISAIMVELDVPIFLAAGNIEAKRTGKYIKELPMLWASEDFPLIVIGGVDRAQNPDVNAVQGWPILQNIIGPQLTTSAISVRVETGGFKAVPDHQSIYRPALGFSSGTSVGASAGTGAAIGAIILDEFHKKDWLDRSELDKPLHEKSTGVFVRSVWKFFAEGLGSRRLGTDSSPRVIRNMLSGLEGAEQCPMFKRDLSNSPVCLADPNNSSSPSSTLLPSTPDATNEYSATCISAKPRESMVPFKQSDVTPAASAYCSSVLPKKPLQTNWAASQNINSWSYNQGLNMVATLKGDKCADYKDSDQCFTEMLSIWQQCPEFGGYLTVPDCVKLEIHPGIIPL